MSEPDVLSPGSYSRLVYELLWATGTLESRGSTEMENFDKQ
jgi:hypothetical protein